MTYPSNALGLSDLPDLPLSDIAALPAEELMRLQDEAGAAVETARRLKASVNRLWLAWTDEADAEGFTDFYGLQRRVAREVFLAGEVFLRFRPRRPEDGLTVPLQLQMIPSEMLPLSRTETWGSNPVRQGIEFDGIGRRVAYAYLSNDMVRANYSNSRLALLEFRRRVEAYQHAVMVWQLCRRVWQRWLDVAVFSGALELPGYERDGRVWAACDWLPPKWDWVDPLKDARAEIEQIEAGLKSRTQALAERGYDAEQVDAEIAADRARERALGLAFASAPAATPAGDPEQVPPGDGLSAPATD